MSGLTHPVTRRTADGRYVELMLDSAVEDVVDRLHNGDPTIGWEGDPNLVLYLEADPDGGSRWVLERLEADCKYHVVCRSRPGVDVRDLPRRLVEHDSRRGHNAVEEMIATNTRLQNEKDAVAADRLAEGLEHAYWGLGKDVGHHYG